MQPHVPGYVLGQPLPSPRGLEAWRGQRAASGERVRLVLVRCEGDLARRDALRAQAARLAALRHPHLLGVRDVVSVTEGIVLVHPEPAGQPLADVVGGRARLRAGELVTLGLPLVAALEAAHAAGVGHGWLSPDWVLVDDVGRPVLTGIGLRGLVDDTVEPARDARAVADLLRGLGGVELPDSSLGQLAAALRSLGPAQPLLHQVDGGEPPRELAQLARVHPRRRLPLTPRLRPRLALSVAAVPLVLLAVVTATRGDAAEGRSTRPLAAAQEQPWLEVLRGLDAARGVAVAAGDPAALEQVYAPGSAALQTERERVQALLAQQLVVRGLDLTVQRVEVVRQGAAEVLLRVTDAMSAYDVLDRRGVVVEHRPARGERTWLLQLRRVAGAWRIGSVQELGR